MSPEIDPQSDFVQEIFEFLTDLRDSGEINMMGAPKVLQKAYGVSHQDAYRLWKAWVKDLEAQ